MKKFLSAAVAASMALGGMPMFTSAAIAGENRQWNGDPATALAALEQGVRDCRGSKKQSICSVDDRTNGFRLVSMVARPDGLNKNVHFITVMLIDPTGVVIRDEAGKPYMIAMHVTDQTNGPAMLSQAFANLLPAAFNGSVAAGINAAFPACGKNCQGNGGAQIVNYNQNVAQTRSDAAVDVDIENVGGGTGPCTTCGPTHTTDGPGSTPYNPGG